jgi:hypothetical protein
MPRGMAWLRFSMATNQRILCQWGRTVAASRHHGRGALPLPHAATPRTSRADPCCTTAALAGHFADAARRQPVHVSVRTNRRLSMFVGSLRGADAARALWRAHSSVRSNRNGGSREGRTDRGRTPAPSRPHARGRVSGERAERSRVASRARCAAGAWRCAKVGDAARAVASGLGCRPRGRLRDEAAAGASARPGAKAGASRAGRRREERPPTASLFAVR